MSHARTVTLDARDVAYYVYLAFMVVCFGYSVMTGGILGTVFFGSALLVAYLVARGDYGDSGGTGC